MRILDKLRAGRASDFPSMLRCAATLLRALTVNIDRTHTKHNIIYSHLYNVMQNIPAVPGIVYAVNTTCAACYLYVYIASVLWFLLARCPHAEDTTVCFLEFSLAVCSVSPIIKLVYIKLYKNTMMNLVDEYLECDRLVVQGTRFAGNIARLLRVVKKRAIVIWTAFIVNGCVYIVLPYLLPGRHLTEDLYVIYGLEPLLESPNYEIASALMIPAIAFGVITLTIITMFIIIIIGYIETQLLALTEELQHIWADSEKFYERCLEYNIADYIYNEKIIRNIFIKKRLRDILKFHIKSIKLHNVFEKGFRVIYLIKFSFIFSAIVAELLCGLENSNIVLPYTFNQVFLDCFIGQRLKDASGVFEEALYKCKWEQFDVANQKTVLLMLQNSRKYLQLTAGGVAALDYPLLMYIIRSTYSVYTTLQSTVK